MSLRAHFPRHFGFGDKYIKLGNTYPNIPALYQPCINPHTWVWWDYSNPIIWAHIWFAAAFQCRWVKKEQLPYDLTLLSDNHTEKHNNTQKLSIFLQQLHQFHTGHCSFFTGTILSVWVGNTEFRSKLRFSMIWISGEKKKSCFTSPSLVYFERQRVKLLRAEHCLNRCHLFLSQMWRSWLLSIQSD